MHVMRKMVRSNKKLIVSLTVSLILLFVIIGVMIFSDKILPKNEKIINVDNEFEKDYFFENCDCLERGRLSCKEGFELRDSACWQNTTFTNPIRSCSKYDCSGTIVVFRGNEWGVQNRA